MKPVTKHCNEFPMVLVELPSPFVLYVYSTISVIIIESVSPYYIASWVLQAVYNYTFSLGIDAKSSNERHYLDTLEKS